MKEDLLYQYHIVESIDKILEYVNGVSRNEFLKSTGLNYKKQTRSLVRPQ